MIKKALILTLFAMLGACSDGDDASRTAASAAKTPSNDHSQGETDTQQNDVSSTENSLADKPIVDEQASLDGIETIVEDEVDDLEDEAKTKITLQAESKDRVEWQAPEEMAYETAEVVVVTPEGDRITRRFATGEPIALNEPLPDGLYKWESVVTPEIDPYVKEEMYSARESGDLQAQQELKKKFQAQGAFPSNQELKDNRQSGAFVVRDGIATPTTTESSGPDERG